jgi:hypothetical protein
MPPPAVRAYLKVVGKGPELLGKAIREEAVA